MFEPQPFATTPEAERALREHVPASDLRFGANSAPVMFSAAYEGGAWQRGELLPFGPVPVLPNARSIQFAESVFEGMKALRRRPALPHLFRPELNARRFAASAARIGMPAVPEALFLQGVAAVASACADLVPEAEGAFLYLRPVLFSTEPGYTVGNSDSFRFIVTASPSAAYARGAMRVRIEREDVRAARHGIGAAKAAANYAAAMRATSRAQAEGFDIALWLDPLQRRCIEELSGMNLFAVIEGELHTPALSDSILSGVTRASVIELARSDGRRVVEREIPIDTLLEAITEGRCTELMATGTAAIIAPVCELGDADGRRYPLPQEQVTLGLRQRLLDIQMRRGPDPFGWTSDVATHGTAGCGAAS